MFNNVYRLTGVRQFERVTTNQDLYTHGRVIVRPTLMSICRADERYYTGVRDKKVLKERLPMSLIHEAIGEVVQDNTGTFEIGTRVVMIPTIAHEHDNLVAENYLGSSKFSSSTLDGFMREYVFMKPENLVVIPTEAQSDINVLLEVASVAVEAIKRLKDNMIDRVQTLGIWGDGNVAYMMAVVAKELFPNIDIYVFGKHKDKLAYISFTNTMQIDNIPDDLKVDHAIEAVGGVGSESAIDQIIDHINPRGTIVLAGVSENPVAINTRMVLEKGIDLVGTTRSSHQDFETAIHLMKNSQEMRERLQLMIQNNKSVEKVSDIGTAFDEDLNMNWGKTIIEWNM